MKTIVVAVVLVTFMFGAVFGATYSACSLPKDTGPCRAYFPKFYYDSALKKCASFGYGGCAGNDNRFDTIEDCKRTCVGCYYNGVYKPPGSSWKVSCNTCSCNGGAIGCTKIGCIVPK